MREIYVNELSILVCDDSKENREELVAAFKEIGIQTLYQASDGEEAVKLSHKFHPQLVFMDIIMPKKDGIAALKEIQQNHPDIKVILSSSTTGKAHLKNTKLLGAYSFIQKPIDREKLKEIIRNYLKEH